ATFCAVIICAIFVASFSFWLVQNTQAETHFQQQRAIEQMLLENAVAAFNARGESGVREVLKSWHDRPGMEKVLVVSGDERKDVLGREVHPKRLEAARAYALSHPDDASVRIEFDRLGEEYLFYIRNWDKNEAKRLPSPLYIPGLPLDPMWHEIIILGFIFLVGLLLAYILANNITKPIRILGKGMAKLAEGSLDTRLSEELKDRDDELSHLGQQFDKMAEQLQKLVEKERHLLHHVSHEMRSPLARMQAILALIESQPQNQARYMARLEGELERMNELVGELLTLSRLESANTKMEKEELKLVPFLRHLVEDSQEIALKNGQTVSIDVGNVPENARLSANESYLYRAFDNVIRNAVNYSPEGSVIQVALSEAGSHWQIDITDNGPGVKPEQLGSIFTAFYRADSSAHKPGTGLGLALTKHIVDQHCGTISAENIAPNGLRMRFVLPKKGSENCEG
ncbi:MAG: HAMP domain-containing sensor histidine kinase, partial [Neisseria sp.]|nr:HAMP domain-containing sensor histidine kinase [Neisseria sp.]